jgi:hypothetical protein
MILRSAGTGKVPIIKTSEAKLWHRTVLALGWNAGYWQCLCPTLLLLIGVKTLRNRIENMGLCNRVCRVVHGV